MVDPNAPTRRGGSRARRPHPAQHGDCFCRGAIQDLGISLQMLTERARHVEPAHRNQGWQQLGLLVESAHAEFFELTRQGGQRGRRSTLVTVQRVVHRGPAQRLTGGVDAMEDRTHRIFVVALDHVERYAILAQPAAGLEHDAAQLVVAPVAPGKDPFGEPGSVEQLGHRHPAARDLAAPRRRMKLLIGGIEVHDERIVRRGRQRLWATEPRHQGGQALLPIDHP
jgi:hypothetical protein